MSNSIANTTTVIAGILFSTSVVASDGMINVASNYSVDETVERLIDVLQSKDFNVIQQVNHSAAAKKVDIALRDTQLILFGKPAVGSLLMQCQQSVAIDLPQKALVWENQSGQVQLSYNDPSYLATRHDLAGCEKVLEKISGALAGVAKAATE